MITAQPDLFTLDTPTSIPYAKHSATSRDAAVAVRPRAMNHERQVYETIVAAGAKGVTRKELAACIGWAENQQNRITGRVAALITAGKVREDHTIQYDRLGEPTWQVVRRDGSAVLIAVGRQG
jgi:hypothetical protein